MIVSSWTSPKTVRGRPSDVSGRGFFAVEGIAKGEITAIKGGHIIDKTMLKANEQIIRGAEAGVADGFYLAPLNQEEFDASMVFYNHSCESNSGFGGNILFVAMRDIKAGEELTIDYAMHHAEPDYSMACTCKTPSCRKTIRGSDWKNPELERKYRGYFLLVHPAED